LKTLEKAMNRVHTLTNAALRHSLFDVVLEEARKAGLNARHARAEFHGARENREDPATAKKFRRLLEAQKTLETALEALETLGNLNAR